MEFMYEEYLTLYQTTKFQATPNWHHLQMTNDTQNVKFVFHRTENIVGKEEIAGYQQKAFSYSASKVVIVW